jgi:hypothetical protein|tara:strand:- start:38370 stop:38882 length:513 start_codon:yes stop_codon:yes gene_type:complete
MIQEESDSTKARVITASLALQAKAGRGKVDDQKVRACQDALAQKTANFKPVALELLDQLEAALHNAAQSDPSDLNEHKAQIFKPIFDLKASAKMFRYDLVTIMANIMVDFLERLKTLDKDAVEIVLAHHKTLTLIIVKKMSGTGGDSGKALAKELQSACTRYFTSRKAAQ